jgi:RNA polymerase sigma-70 factor (ECF subfamily)
MVEDFDPGDNGQSAEVLAENVEAQRLRAMVEKLPEDQRLALKLTLLGEHSYQEAADILGIPEGTLTSRIARGRAALLRQYQKKGH